MIRQKKKNFASGYMAEKNRVGRLAFFFLLYLLFHFLSENFTSMGAT